MLKSQNVKWIFLIIVVVFLLWALNSYATGKRENYLDLTGTDYQNAYRGSPRETPSSRGRPTASPKRENFEDPDGFEEGFEPEMPDAEGFENYSSQNVANPSDLLPVDQNSQWAALNPVQNKYPQLPDLLQAGNLIGLDTIGQTLKNANYQLRSDPIINKTNVGPWNNSTYEPDLARVPLELGNCNA